MVVPIRATATKMKSRLATKWGTTVLVATVDQWGWPRTAAIG